MNNNLDIFNWERIFQSKEDFENKKPFPYGFGTKVLQKNFYDYLVETYPGVDEKWYIPKDFSRSAIKRLFGNDSKNQAYDNDDSSLSTYWNKFRHYLFTKEFFENFSKYTGIKLSGIRHFVFIKNRKGDFNMPHLHWESSREEDYSYKITVLMYFCKGWHKGDLGGTYVCESEDESSIIFEATDLDNSMIWFKETPNSWHGSKYITKDVVRPSIQFTLY